MFEDYFVVDIETCPIDLVIFKNLDEEEKLKLINPIDSKVVAIGVRRDNENKVFMGDEVEILKNFWKEWETIKMLKPHSIVVGFGINNFDLPFLVSRSFVHRIKIVPFVLKVVVDLRDKVNAYRYGKTRGKLSDYGKLMGLNVLDVEGGDVAKMCLEENYEKLKEYLENDLKITDEMFKRARETNILQINKW